MFRSSSSRPLSAGNLDSFPRSQHRRSASDLAHLIHSRREPPKNLSVHQMVRLSGKSSLYLPLEYSPCSLILPTCLRATAQYIAQHADTRGIFRVPGSMKVVSAIFDYYCHIDKGGVDISSTVRSATLPFHIQYSAHDIGSTFKRLLSVLPGGILGSLALFDAFIAINSQLHGEPEFPRTKQSKVRARLIALVIGTIESQYRRELICAVFGLLSMIGRVAELAPREDEHGRPLPTGDLMGYSSLAIVIGPLLIGDLLQSYSMKLASHDGGLIVLPPAAQQVRQKVRKGPQRPNALKAQPTVDKINVAIGITEMLISNWRDIVRQMKSLGTHHRRQVSSSSIGRSSLRSSASETLLLRLPREFTDDKAPFPNSHKSGHESDPETPTAHIVRPRSRIAPKRVSSFLAQKPSMNTLSPTMEESPVEDISQQESEVCDKTPSRTPAGEPNATRYSNVKHKSAFGGRVHEDIVPPRSSSRDQSCQRISSATQTEISYRSDDFSKIKESYQGPSPSCHGDRPKTPVSLQHSSWKSYEQTPPHFYSPQKDPITELSSSPLRKNVESMAIPDATRSVDRLQPQAKNAKAQPLDDSRTPQSDTKCEIRRYKRDCHPVFMGSPCKKPAQKPGSVNKMTAMFEGPSVSNQTTLPRTNENSYKGNDESRNLKKAKSGPLRAGVSQREQTYPSVQRSSVHVWRNGVKQKSSFAKVLRASKSDGNSLRASALHDLFSPVRKNAKQRSSVPQLGPSAVTPITLDESHDPCRMIDERSSHNPIECESGGSLTLNSISYRNDVEYLHRIIHCLRDRLLEERLITEGLRKQIQVEGMVEHKLIKDALEAAKNDASIWREKAQSAERRLKVFEKFTARLRGIRDAAVLTDGSGSHNSEVDEKNKENGFERYAMPLNRVRFAEAEGLDGKELSQETEHCSCLGSADEDERTRQRDDQLDRHSFLSTTSSSRLHRAANLEEVANLWMAAKELLDMEGGIEQ